MLPAPTPREPDPTPRQRLRAAQRLAAGDPLRVAAVLAGIRTEVLRLLLAEDPDFAGLVEDCRALAARSREERRERLEGLLWEATEQAVMDGRVTTLNLCLRTLGTLEDLEGDEDPMAAFYASLTDEQMAEYEGLGDEGEGCRARVLRAETLARRAAKAGRPRPAEPEPVPGEADDADSDDAGTVGTLPGLVPAAPPVGRATPAPATGPLPSPADLFPPQVDPAAWGPARLGEPGADGEPMLPWPFSPPDAVEGPSRPRLLRDPFPVPHDPRPP